MHVIGPMLKNVGDALWRPGPETSEENRDCLNEGPQAASEIEDHEGSAAPPHVMPRCLASGQSAERVLSS